MQRLATATTHRLQFHNLRACQIGTEVLDDKVVIIPTVHKVIEVIDVMIVHMLQ